MPTPTPRLIHKAGNKLGEGVCYDPVRGFIHWVDIPNRKICKLDSQQRYSELTIDSEPGFLVVTENGALVVGAGKSLLLINDDRIVGKFALDCTHQDTTINDGSVSLDGRTLFFGTKHLSETLQLGESFIVGERPLSTRQRFTVFNGPAFAPDNRQVYFTDSPSRIIQVADFDPESGRLSNKRQFARIPDDQGYPDGMAIDHEGGLWNAQWDGARITRYLPDGAIDRVIALPVCRPTSLAFCGHTLTTLIITSAEPDAPSDVVRPNHIQDGDLLAIDVDIPGVELPAYGGSFLTRIRVRQ